MASVDDFELAEHSIGVLLGRVVLELKRNGAIEDPVEVVRAMRAAFVVLAHEGVGDGTREC